MSTVQTMTIVEFLRARLDEDEQEPNWRIHTDWCAAFAGQPCDCDIETGRLRVLREVEAKRRIVDLHPYLDLGRWRFCAICRPVDPESPGDLANERWPCRTLRALALPYADHPDYDESWRP